MNHTLKPFLGLALLLLASGLLAVDVVAQDKPAAKPSQEELITKLEKMLTGAKMTGSFTVLGKDAKPPSGEEYTIVSAERVEGDIWMLKARIKYGTTDKTMPVPLQIQWAGDTPVITMTDMAVPGLGTFSTRVVIYDGMYSGTWRHGEVKGQMFGTITPGDAKPGETKAAETKPAVEK
ncbi:hypothetical protein NA78x_002017 [Anatilimnocola sp. NA78]|uniref:hypothetical protein n=1 Tax=Anatilimnocola sp. NA78 TaxID=3415683 RepID=UPI003CE4F5CF